MEHNDLVIMDIGGQALGILLHRTESAQNSITVKAYTLSHIYSHIQTELDNSKTENSPNLAYKYSAVLSTGSKKSSEWPQLSRVYPVVASHQRSTPDLLCARSKNMKWVPVSLFL